MKTRLDALLVERGLARSRERAVALILSGDVLVNEVPVTKAGQPVSNEAVIRLRSPDHPYVSRGALKLKKALESFGIDVKGKSALDVGASTGGFTEILLEEGATRVCALDVGHNQLDWKIRSDARVRVLEGINARNLKFEELGERYDVIVMDLSFIGLAKVIPALLQFADADTDWVTLIKPQFELEPGKVGKGGIVTDPAHHQEAVEGFTQAAHGLGLVRKALIPSPITGTQGNQEFLAHWKLG